MKKLLLAGFALVASSVSAMAADIPARPVYKVAPMVAAMPAWNWTGFYIGGHIGTGWGSKEWFNGDAGDPSVRDNS